jgi:hypothetical protein
MKYTFKYEKQFSFYYLYFFAPVLRRKKNKRHIFLIITINIELILKCKRVLYKDVGASEGFFFKEIKA